MRKWLIPLLVLALLAGGGAAALAIESATGGPDGEPVTSADELGPGECSLVHNLDACDGAGDSVVPGAAGMCLEGATDCVDTVDSDGDMPVRSDEGIDPDECNLVHNIDACTAADCERLEADPALCEAGRADKPAEGPSDEPISSGDGIAPDDCSLVHNLDSCE
jgi:hypothetical protein